MTKEYIVHVRVKNNLLLTIMEREGYSTVNALARASGLTNKAIGQIANLKSSGMTAINPRWRPIVERLATFLRCLPEDIIPKAQVHAPLERNTGSFTADLPDLAAFGSSARAAMLPPSVAYENAKKAETLAELLSVLTPREQTVLRTHFGLDDGNEKTFDEAAKAIGGVSRERARQVELKALRKLRRAVYLRKIEHGDLAPESA